MTSPKVIIEDVLIKVGKFIFPVDFMVLDMEEDEKAPLILGRPFLATSRALIDVESGELTLRVGDDKVQLSVYKKDKLQKKKNEVCMILEALPMQKVEIMKEVPNKASEKGPNVTSSDEEQRARKWNSSLNAKMDQAETVPFMRKVDVMYLSVEGIKKSTTYKEEKT